MLADLPPLAGRSGVIIAGNGTEGPNAVLSLADALGWPVLADHSSGCRAPGTIVHFDALLRTSAFVDGLSPEVVLRFGEPLASRQLSRWLAGLDAEFVSVVPDGRWIDPEGRANVVINDGKAVLSFLAAVDGQPSREVDVWRWLDTVAGDAIETTLEAGDALTEPTIAREVVGGIESGSALVVAASLPERDVESYGPQRDDIEVFATRSNGGGGAVAIAIGVASTGVPTTVLLDEGALLRDSSSLVGLGERPLYLTMVVIGDSPGPGDPYRPDVEAVATAHGLAVHRWGQGAEARDGVRIVLAGTDHDKDLQLRNQLNTAASEAVTAALRAAR